MMVESSRHFYDKLEGFENVGSISDFVLDYLSPSGVNGIFIARLPAHSEPISATIILDSWNPDWTKEYARGDFVRLDPIAQHLLRTRDPFVWSEVCTTRQLTSVERRIMDGARDFGLIDGVTVPIHDPTKGVTCISFSTRGGRLEKFDQEKMRFIGILTLSRIERIVSVVDADVLATRPRKRLSAQEVRCLNLAWRGFNSKQIAQKIGLTHRTVDQYLAKAMNKLNARNRTDAARIAMELGFMNKL